VKLIHWPEVRFLDFALVARAVPTRPGCDSVDPTDARCAEEKGRFQNG
jgi:hypothetical protein